MSKNDITGDRLVSKTATDAYRDNFDKIFGKKTTNVTYGKSEEFDTEQEMVERITGDYANPTNHPFGVSKK